MSDKDLYVNSDKYFNNQDEFADLEAMGFDVCPIDKDGGFVPKDKNDADNLEESQETIRRRFHLGK